MKKFINCFRKEASVSRITDIKAKINALEGERFKNCVMCYWHGKCSDNCRFILSFVN